jgi:hypothetical protein
MRRRFVIARETRAADDIRYQNRRQLPLDALTGPTVPRIRKIHLQTSSFTRALSVRTEAEGPFISRQSCLSRQSSLSSDCPAALSAILMLAKFSRLKRSDGALFR